MEKIVNIPEERTNKVQRADVDMCSRRDIIAFIIDKNMNIDNEKFKTYQDEYAQAYFKFQQEKSNIEKDFVDPNMNNNQLKQFWNLNYATNELIITYEEKNK